MDDVKLSKRGGRAILRRKRTEQLKAKRRIMKDKGLKYSEGYFLAPAIDGCSNTLTTVSKDNLLLIWSARC